MPTAPLLTFYKSVAWIKNDKFLKETCRFLAEKVGFEPTRRVNALRDFESRLFDH